LKLKKQTILVFPHHLKVHTIFDEEYFTNYSLEIHDSDVDRRRLFCRDAKVKIQANKH
jgi:hypothetical protein